MTLKTDFLKAISGESELCVVVDLDSLEDKARAIPNGKAFVVAYTKQAVILVEKLGGQARIAKTPRTAQGTGSAVLS